MYLRMVGSSPSSSPVCPWRSSAAGGCGSSGRGACRARRLRRVSRSDRSVVSMTPSGSPSGAEVRDRRGTADALNPDVLRPGNVGGDVVGGDDHLSGEGLIDTVAGAV